LSSPKRELKKPRFYAFSVYKWFPRLTSSSPSFRRGSMNSKSKPRSPRPSTIAQARSSSSSLLLSSSLIGSRRTISTSRNSPGSTRTTSSSLFGSLSRKISNPNTALLTAKPTLQTVILPTLTVSK